MATKYDFFLSNALRLSAAGAVAGLAPRRFPQGTTFVVDPGHGEATPGKRWNFGDLSILEWIENRRVAMELGLELTRRGARVVFTVPPSDKSDPPLIDAPKLKGRVRRGNEVVEASAFLSIHHNAANGRASGYEGFTAPGFDDADLMLARITHRVKDLRLPAEEFPGYVLKNRGDKEAKFAVLVGNKTTPQKHPALLLELGFFDNCEEAEVIQSEAWPKAWAQVITEGLLDYFHP